jgi:hypothetical protein
MVDLKVMLRRKYARFLKQQLPFISPFYNDFWCALM